MLTTVYQTSVNVKRPTVVTLAVEPYSRSVYPMNLAERMEWVLRERGLSHRKWAEAAGLSERYVSVTLHRARKDPDFRPDYLTMRKLADAAEVSIQWLAEGAGEPPRGSAKAPAAAPPPKETRVVRDDLPDALRALLVAYRGSDAEPEDFESLYRIVRDGRPMVAPGADVNMVEVMARWLDAARAVRLAGQPVNLETIAWWFATHGAPRAVAALDARSDALNAEADAELRALGAVPPTAPVLPRKPTG